MTKIGRVVAGVGAVVVGVLVTVLTTVAVRAVVPESSAWLALVQGMLGLVVFGVVTAALYTWTVDGPFVRTSR